MRRALGCGARTAAARTRHGCGAYTAGVRTAAARTRLQSGWCPRQALGARLECSRQRRRELGGLWQGGGLSRMARDETLGGESLVRGEVLAAQCLMLHLPRGQDDVSADDGGARRGTTGRGEPEARSAQQGAQQSPRPSRLRRPAQPIRGRQREHSLRSCYTQVQGCAIANAQGRSAPKRTADDRPGTTNQAKRAHIGQSLRQAHTSAAG